MTTYCDATTLPRATGPRESDPQPAADALLSRQLGYVADHSRFYRPILRRHGRHPTWTVDDLCALPFSTREDLQNDQEQNPPFGSYHVADARVARVHRTSGSSGRPLIIALSARDVEDSVVCGARCFKAAGVTGDDLIVHCLSYCMWSGGITDHLALERAGAGVIPYGVGNSINLLRIIMSLAPTGIHCTPSYLAKLEQRLREEFGTTPASLGLKLGLFGGEPGLQDPNFRARIERDWGFRAMDANYGMAEVLSMFGAECEIREGLHFMGQGVVWPELKDPAGNDVLPWEPGARGEIVLTHLRRECQPLVRYRTSDLIEVIAAGPCPCGRPTPRWRIIGRADDMLVIRGTNVYLAAISRIVNSDPDRLTGEYLLLVSRTEPIGDCLLKIEAQPGKEQHQLGRKLEDRLTRELGVRIPVTMVPGGRLPRTDGKSRRLRRTL